MIDVGIFGCSFSSSSYPNTWPNFFAENNLNKFNVIDYAYPGTSIEYSIWRLEQFKKEYPKGKTIFQITGPNRHTCNVGTTFEKQERFNYKRVLVDWDDICIRTVAHAKDKDKLSKWFLNSLRYTDDWNKEINWKLALHYVKNNTDFAFAHKQIDDKTFPCIQDVCTEDEWKYFCKMLPFDQHFNHHGVKWQAKWVYEQVKQWT